MDPNPRPKTQRTHDPRVNGLVEPTVEDSVDRKTSCLASGNACDDDGDDDDDDDDEETVMPMMIMLLTVVMLMAMVVWRCYWGWRWRC